ncbi:hypothetical protein [Sagittula salina]|nr:hypothetical protein [Sagittula salina]
MKRNVAPVIAPVIAPVAAWLAAWLADNAFGEDHVQRGAHPRR